MKIRHIALVGLLLPGPAFAQYQVVDTPALAKWAQQATAMAQQLRQLEAEVTALTNMPANLTSAVSGLLNQAVQNPLGQITQNLNTLLKGQGPGSCGNSQVYLTSNTYQAPVGTDFTSQSMNQQINRQAGLQACTQQMMASSQNTLSQLPGLLSQLQSATDITSATAIAARIQVQIATMQAQQQQAQLLASSGLLQSQMTQMQIQQKQRADANEVYQNTLPGTTAGTIPQVTPFAAPGS